MCEKQRTGAQEMQPTCVGLLACFTACPSLRGHGPSVS